MLAKKYRSKLWLLALVIPVVVVLVIFYFNYSFFGYSDEQTIKVGSPEDGSGIFYLEDPFRLIGSRQKRGEDVFRTLNGLIYAVYSPLKVLKNVAVKVDIDSDDSYILSQPKIENINWDYEFDFKQFEPNRSSSDISLSEFLSEKEVSFSDIDNWISSPFALQVNYIAEQDNNILDGDIILKQDSSQITLDVGSENLIYKLPDYYIGTEHSIVIGYDDNNEEIFLFVDDELVGRKKIEDVLLENLKKPESFGNGEIKIYSGGKYSGGKKYCQDFDESVWLRANSALDAIKPSPFVIYLKWVPKKSVDSQRLIGFKSWAVWQNKDSVRFTVGRTNIGAWRSVEYLIGDSFFGKEHNLLAVYNPAQNEGVDGYIDLYVDGLLVGRNYIGKESIASDYWYNERGRLLFGGGNGGREKFFSGEICDAKLAFTKVSLNKVKKMDFFSTAQKIKIPIFGNGGMLRRVDIVVESAY